MRLRGLSSSMSITPPPSVKVFVVDGTAYSLSTLHRHMLYAIDEGREVSSRYDEKAVRITEADLFILGLIDYSIVGSEDSTDPEIMMVLTELGKKVLVLAREASLSK